MIDLTARKATEEALRQSEQQFRALTEGISQLVWTSTADGHCDYVSCQWEDYTGIPCSEQVGKQWVVREAGSGSNCPDVRYERD